MGVCARFRVRVCVCVCVAGNYFLMARTLTPRPPTRANIAGALPMYLTFVFFGCLVFGSLTERF